MKFIQYPFIALLFLASCNSSNEEKPTVIDVPATEKEAMEQTLNDKDRLDKTKQIYAVLPTPIETSVMLRDAGVIYNSSTLTAPEKAFEYQTSLAQAFNLGIYGSDLSFAAAYGQQGDLVSYLGSIKVLGDNLNITNVFNEALINDVEENIENQTELLRLISEAYWSANNDLNQGERGALSALILAGSWVEALSIGLGVIADNPNSDAIIEKIGQQRYTLELILEVLEDASTDEGVKGVYEDLNAINAIYEKMPYTGEEFDVEDPVTGDIKKGVLKNVQISEEVLEELKTKTFLVREKYMNLK